MKTSSWHLLALAGLALTAGLASAHLGPIPVSLKGVPVPPTPGLTDGPDPIVINKQKAIALGKALFWDMNVGSDGMACASCHFSAGADARTKNQRAPASKFAKLDDGQFSLRFDGQPSGPNDTLRRGDFPLFQTAAPMSEDSPVIRQTDDTIGSAGVFKGQFRNVELSEVAADDCAREAGAVFHVGSAGTRQVEQRNAPSVFNAAFNHRLLWDGAANNIFNGSSQWGMRDTGAGVWIKQANGQTIKVRLQLENAALASQAVSVPTNTTEMSCANRTFGDLARKLLMRRPLENQHVHWNDSVLGPYAYAKPDQPAKGLKTYYMHLVRGAFNSKYWSDLNRNAAKYGMPQPTSSNPQPYAYNQYEANFAMFFGIALQLYQQTLISDDSPLDRSARDAEGLPIDLSASAQRGLQVFRDAHCNLCHVGPHLTSAAVASNAYLVRLNPDAFGSSTISVATTDNVVTRQLANGVTGFIDTGYAATGVAHDDWDPGLAGKDAFGNPLSFSMQYLDYLTAKPGAAIDPQVATIRACDLQSPIAQDRTDTLARIFTRVQGIQPQAHSTDNCYNPAGAFVPTPAAAAAELALTNNQRMRTVIQSAFKIPNLRNVELTGPYMHNGSMASLEEVIEFYTRGGNFHGVAKQTGFVFGQPLLELDATSRADLLAFLKSLTDERVRYAQAPFDHPEIFVPHGHPGDTLVVDQGNPLDPLLAKDALLHVEAVGATGRATPIVPFAELLAP
ncbi:MAG: cytochrome c peroxidase [Thiobacillus sp.]